MLKISKSEAIV